MAVDTIALGPVPSVASPASSPPPQDDLEPTDDELEALVNDPAAKWCTAEEVMARLREIDACTS
jgi:hypothetical protein